MRLASRQGPGVNFTGHPLGLPTGHETYSQTFILENYYNGYRENVYQELRLEACKQVRSPLQ